MSTDWHAELRSRGLRLTPQREMILAAVDRLDHATPDEVLVEVRTHAASVNISTVYRTLELLEELGLVRHAHLNDRAPTYHSVGGREHFHLVCRTCHNVVSVPRETLEPVTSALVEEHGFVPDVGHLTVFGTCRSCTQEGTDDRSHD